MNVDGRKQLRRGPRGVDLSIWHFVSIKKRFRKAWRGYSSTSIRLKLYETFYFSDFYPYIYPLSFQRLRKGSVLERKVKNNAKAVKCEKEYTREKEEMGNGKLRHVLKKKKKKRKKETERKKNKGSVPLTHVLMYFHIYLHVLLIQKISEY